MMHINSRILKIIFLIFLCMMQIGCWDRKEPKKMAMVTSAVYDIKDDGNYQITIEITNPGSKGSDKKDKNDKSTSIIYMGENLSIPESARGISQSLDKSLFSSHTKVRFLSEKFAKSDVVPFFDYLLRSYHLDENPLVAVIKGKDPSKIYQCEIGLSATVGEYIENMSNSQPSITSKSVFMDASGFIKDYFWHGKQPVTGVLEILPKNTPTPQSAGKDSQESKNQTLIKYEGLAAFKDNKLVGYMDGVEARAYNFVTNNMKTSIFSVPTENEYTVFLVDGSKSKIKTFINSGQISAEVKIKVDLSAIEEGGNINITDLQAIKMLENQVNSQLKKEIEAAIQKAQSEFQSDIFGFGIYMHAQHPQEWKEIKDKWDDHFSKAKIDVKIDSSIKRTGQIKHAFREENM